MSTGDGRHKLASNAERELHAEIAAATRAVVDGYCKFRQHQQRDGEGYEIKRSVFQREIADHLGISERQLSAYQRDVPITLAKAVLLSRFCGDERLLALFAGSLGAVAVALPLPDLVLEPKMSVLECSALLRAVGEAQQAANEMMGDGLTGPDAARRTIKECREAIVQLTHAMMLHELAAFGTATLHLVSWARRRNPEPGIIPNDPNTPRPGWWPDHGYEGDSPEK